MKRTLLVVLIGVVVAAAAVVILRREPQLTEEPDVEFAETGQFLSDSLGVGMLLPESPGWSFQRHAAVPSGPYVTAVHQSEKASVRLYVHEHANIDSIEEVVQRRRDTLAGHFRVRDIDDVIEQVMKETSQEVGGYPAFQWQAVTEPVAVTGAETSRVMFMLVVVERPEHLFEILGLLSIPQKPGPEQEEAELLARDLAFVLQSFQIR
jgi:hypothetical protein